MKDKRAREIIPHIRTMPVPNQETAARHLDVVSECWTNTARPELGGRTPWRARRSTRGRQALLALFEQTAVPDVFIKARLEAPLKRIWRPGQRLLGALVCSGGALNLFLDRPELIDDIQWPRILAEEQALALRQGRDEQSALAAANMRWNHEPSSLFSSLTPAQVIAGGGPVEDDLVQSLSAYLERHLGQVESFRSPGAMVKAFLTATRRWQVEPMPKYNGRIPEALIVEERQQIWEYKQAFLERMWSRRAEAGDL